MNENSGVPGSPQTNEYSGVIGSPVNQPIPGPQMSQVGNENLGVIGAPSGEANPEKNKKSKKKFLIGALLILIILGVGLFFVYKKLSSNPVTIYENTINEVYKFLHEGIVEAQKVEFEIDIENEPFVVDLNADLNSTMSELSKFSGYNYGLQVGMDYKNKKANLAIDIKENNTEVINAIVSFINSKAYLKSDKLINRVLDMGEMDLFSEMDLDSIMSTTEEINIDYNDIDYVLKSIKDIVISSLDKEKFTVTDTMLTINGKEHKVNKVEYALDQANMDRTIKHIITKMVEDQTLLDILAKISDTSASEIKTSLQEALNEEIDYTGYETIYVVLYTNGLNVTVAGELVIDGKKIVTFDCLDDKWNVFIDGDTNTLALNNNGEYTAISYKENGSELFNLKVYLDDEDIKIDYVINVDGTYTGTIELKNVDVSNNKVVGTYSFSVNSSGTSENINLAVSGSIKIEKTNVNTVNTAGSVAVDSLTETEITEFYNNLVEVLDRFGLADTMGMDTDLSQDVVIDNNITSGDVYY